MAAYHPAPRFPLTGHALFLWCLQVCQLVTLCGMSTGGDGVTGSGAERQAVDDLCLSFTLPGYDRVHLLARGDQEAVTADRLALYLQRLLSVSLVEAVQEELRALTDGFHDIVPPGAIARFTVDEVVSMLGGTRPARAQHWCVV